MPATSRARQLNLQLLGTFSAPRQIRQLSRVEETRCSSSGHIYQRRAGRALDLRQEWQMPSVPLTCPQVVCTCWSKWHYLAYYFCGKLSVSFRMAGPMSNAPQMRRSDRSMSHDATLKS